MTNIREFALERFGENTDGWRGQAKIELMRVLDVNDKVRAEHARIAADPKLSALGRQDATRQYVVKIAPQLVRAQRSVDVIKGKIAERLTRLKPPASDKTDAATAILRSELRTQVRGMKNGERMQLLLAPNADPTLVAAVLEAPNFSSGIDSDTRELLTKAVIEKRYPGALAAIESAEETAEILTSAVSVTERMVYAAGDFPSEKAYEDFLAGAVPTTAHIDAELNRNFSALADVA